MFIDNDATLPKANGNLRLFVENMGSKERVLHESEQG